MISRRPWFWIGGFGVATLVAGCSVATQSADVTDLVKEQYQLSRIEFQQSGRRGIVTRQGVVFVLGIEGVSANALRIRPAARSSKSARPLPAQHVRNYAAVPISDMGPAPASGGEFTLPRGTRLVVLERKVERDRVRLFTHTLEPVRKADGTSAYGCTEFIFPVEQGLDTPALQSRIDRVLLPGA